MKILTHKILVIAVLLFFSLSASAQIFNSNNRGISPPGSPFNPLGKFTALGESGGAPGPTADGCDLYGFRAQTAIGQAVSLGIRAQNINIFGTVLRLRIPTLQWGDRNTLQLVAKESNGTFNAGCGNLVGYFNGNPGSSTKFVIFGSAVASGGNWQASDRRLKREVREIGDALKIVQNLRGVKYSYQSDAYPTLGLSDKQEYGFIAQEVEEVMPEAVRDAEINESQDVEFKVMQYTQIIPVLTEAIKEQQVIIDDQEDRLIEQYEINANYEKLIANLEARLSALEENAQGGKRASINRAVKTAEGISLRQNFPNPFNGETVVEYTIPVDMKAASLTVYDLTGKQQLNSIELAPGSGEITLNAESLAPGVYFYTIEQYNQTLARQKMIVK